MTRIDSLDARPLSIPFRSAFKHASAERASTQSIWVEARAAGLVGLGEGCPREYVTNESVASALRFADRHRAAVLGPIRDAASLAAYVHARSEEIDANPAAWCAIELSVLDLFARSRGTTVESLLCTPEVRGTFRYTAVIGDGPARAFDAQLRKYVEAGFRDFKIKLSGDIDRDREKAVALRAAGIAPQFARADANNLFATAGDAIRHLQGLDYDFFAIEEPLRAGDYAGMREVARVLGAKIIVDESVLRAQQLDLLAPDAPSWIVNLRVSKMGGLIRSLAVASRARFLGIPLIVGAHVGETSVLTRAGLTVATYARDIVLAQEGAFGTHLLEHDMTDVLLFGAGGLLRV
jgi:L-Ala-D/L-Glu epimerase